MTLRPFTYDRIAESFSESFRMGYAGEVSDALIKQAIEDANSRVNQLILDLAVQYPELDQAGIFAGVIAQHALYLTAAAIGPERARCVAEDGVTAFEYDQLENHA